MNANKRFSSLIAAVLALSLLLGIGITAHANDAVGTLSKDEVDKIVETATNKAEVTSPFIEISKKAQESVVGVNNYQIARRSQFSQGFGYFFDQTPEEFEQERRTGTGSGTVISPYGHVLTNYHVISNASRVTVNVGDRELEAAVLGTDADLDIAVLLVPGLDLPHVTLGDSDEIQVGEYAIVIGNPLGTQFERSVSVGIVSAVSRTMTSRGRDRYGLRTEIENNMIQVDAAISPAIPAAACSTPWASCRAFPPSNWLTTPTPSHPATTPLTTSACACHQRRQPLIRTVLENYNAEEAEAQAQRCATRKPSRQRTRTPQAWAGRAHWQRALTCPPASIVPQGAFVIEVFENPQPKSRHPGGDIIVEADGDIITTNSQLIAKINEKSNGDELKLKVYRVTGLLDALEDSSKLRSLGKGEYIDIKAVLTVEEEASM